MKSPRINWKSLTIHSIMNADFSHVENEALREQLATTKFNRLYRQARTYRKTNWTGCALAH